MHGVPSSLVTLAELAHGIITEGDDFLGWPALPPG